jgi:hypothetical protein
MLTSGAGVRRLETVDPYGPAGKEFALMIKELEGLGATSHVELGKQIQAALERIGASAYQGHLDKLFEAECAEVQHWPRPPGSEVRVRERELEIEFGRVVVRRHGYRLAGETSARFPLDEALNLPAELYGLPLRERVAREASVASYDRTVEHVDDVTAGHVPKRQSEALAMRAAADFDAFYEARVPPANDALGPRALQVMSVDGKGVTMRPEALREATRKEAEATQSTAHRGDPMAQRRARRSDKRMAVVTAVWEQERFARTAHDVLERLGRDPKGRARKPRTAQAPRPQNKRVAASVKNSLAEGVAKMFDEAQRRNPDSYRETVVLVDGAEYQLAQVEAEAKKRGMHVAIVLDLIHALHYLWTIAMILCASDEREAEAWTARTLEQLLTKHPLDVVAIIRQTATIRAIQEAERRALDDAVEYLHKNSVYIHYAQFLTQGLPIATGVIEGACRHLVQDRMGLTGARWGLDGAEAILKLRAIRVSGDWDAYWAFHVERERNRNHPNAARA